MGNGRGGMYLGGRWVRGKVECFVVDAFQLAVFLAFKVVAVAAASAVVE